MKRAVFCFLIGALILLQGCSALTRLTSEPPPPEEAQTPAETEAEPERPAVKRPRYIKPCPAAPSPEKARLAIEKKLKLAGQYLDADQYDQVVPLAEEILTTDPDNSRAVALRNEASYRWGERLFHNGDYQEALQMMKRLPSDYRDAESFKERIHRKMLVQAEALYKIGVMHFINEDLEKAIDSWEKTRALNPEHPSAQKDIENAKNLLEEYEKIEQP
ncbi:MAG: tetratricopeptide repeat protein [Desulfosudaceae bacterium]